MIVQMSQREAKVQRVQRVQKRVLPPKYLVKMVILGAQQTGKTALLTKYVDGEVSPYYRPTSGVEFRAHTISLNSKHVTLYIWECGDDTKRPIHQAYQRMANIALITYSVADRNSFTAVPKYLQQLQIHDTNVELVLVGTHADRKENERQVTTEEGHNFAKAQRMFFVETSAIEDMNVDAPFIAAIPKVLVTLPPLPPP